MTIDELVIEQDRIHAMPDYTGVLNTTGWGQVATPMAGPLYPATKDQVQQSRLKILDDIRKRYNEARDDYEALVKSMGGESYTFGSDVQKDVTIIRWREAEEAYTGALRQYIRERQ
jgi:hypothetical protein